MLATISISMLKVPNALFLTKFRLINLFESFSNDNGDRTELHLQTKHRMDYVGLCDMYYVTYSTDYYQRLTLESWFTNLEQTPLNPSQQLPAPYKRLIDEIKQN